MSVPFMSRKARHIRLGEWIRTRAAQCIYITKSLQTRELSTDLTLRGKKLVLQYTNGSPCATSKISKRATISDDDDDDDYYEEVVRYKSTLISFICEKDPTAKQAAPSYVGTDPDECAYFFEVKSQHACGGSEPTKQGVGPGAVFTIIGVIAILVYFLGGVFYQRNVAHARGLRQLPNYSMWAGIGNFIKVSGQSCFLRLKHMVFPRITSVRDGILPTMEVRPSARIYQERSKWRFSSGAPYPP